MWIVGLLLTLLLIAGDKKEVLAKEEPTIHTGVYIEDLNVSGMTQAEAEEAVAAYINELGSEVLSLEIFEEQIDVTLEELGIGCTNLHVIGEALQLGKTGNIIRRYKEKKDLEHENKIYDLEWTLDSGLVEDFVSTECIQFDQAAKDMGLEKTDGGFQVIPGTTGVKLDTTEAARTITDYVEQEWDGRSGRLTLPVETDYPRGSEEELRRVKDVLGTFTTGYTTSGADRSQNVANGTRLINGLVLYPGDTFSAYEVVHPFTQENGYRMAGSYLNGKVVDSLGGGICQVSTTLYNAVLRAELEIVERSNHSMIVTYVDPAADAAIAGTYKDFKFKNNTDAPIYIEGITENKRVTFTIYGEETRPANRTVQFISKTLSTTNPGQVIMADPMQPIGYHVAESAHWGYVAELYKHVYVDGKEESVTRINKSTYKASPRMITVGVAGDPGLSAELQAAVATQDEATVNAVLASCLSRMQ